MSKEAALEPAQVQLLCRVEPAEFHGANRAGPCPRVPSASPLGSAESFYYSAVLSMG